MSIVIDIGSAMTRVGHDKLEDPVHTFPTLVGKPRYKGLIGIDQKAFYLCEETVDRKAVLEMISPVKDGMIHNKDLVIRILEHAIRNYLRAVGDQGLTISYDLRTDAGVTSSVIEAAFESYDFESVMLVDPGVAISRAYGFQTGITVDMGNTCTRIHKIQDGKVVKNKSKYLKIGGVQVSQNLLGLLASKAVYLTPTIEAQIANEIKEQYSFVNLGGPTHSCDAVSYILPDLTVISLGKELFDAPNMIFTEHSDNFKGLHRELLDSLTTTTLGQNPKIMTAGGCSKIRGFRDRLQEELQLKASVSATQFEQSNIVSQLDPAKYVMYGLQLMSAHPTTVKEYGITRGEYQERGAVQLSHTYSLSQIH